MSFKDFFDVEQRVLVIAEIGTNHNGDYQLAEELMMRAIESGVDAVKFQAYNTAKFFTPEVPAFERAKKLGYEKQYDRFTDLELTAEQFTSLAKKAHEKNVIFMATPFDEDSLAMLDPMVPAYKIASGDLINHLLLKQVSAKGKPCILSTGQAEEEEIAAAVKLFPADSLSLLHCVSSYPTPDEQVNLRSISYLQKHYPDLIIGYSDHSIGPLACIAAVAMGARIIEKHFTLDKSQPYGDHRLSSEPDEMAYICEQIRRLEKMHGHETTSCQDAERDSRKQLRRNLHVKHDLKKGDVLTEEMILPVVSMEGILANRLSEVVNKKVLRDFQAGEPLVMEDLE